MLFRPFRTFSSGLKLPIPVENPIEESFEESIEDMLFYVFASVGVCVSFAKPLVTRPWCESSLSGTNGRDKNEGVGRRQLQSGFLWFLFKQTEDGGTVC